MINSRGKIKGLVTVTVRDRNGHVRYFKNGFWRRLLKLPERPMIFRHHNTMTTQGDGMIADLMISNPTLTKVDATNGYMRVGTGWTGTTPKNNTGVNTPTGSFKKFDTLDEGITGFINNLSKNYFSVGRDTVETIAPKYCEGNEWASKINYFVNKIKNS